MSDTRLLNLNVGDVHAPSSVGIVGGYSVRPATQHAALVIVRNAEGDILTVSRPEPPYEQSLPGGMVEDGETPRPPPAAS